MGRPSASRPVGAARLMFCTRGIFVPLVKAQVRLSEKSRPSSRSTPSCAWCTYIHEKSGSMTVSEERTAGKPAGEAGALGYTGAPAAVPATWMEIWLRPLLRSASR